mmetsp:Transcript_1951/g.2161  ORF Transcript_1951/g.2161 Transcript_1951/m.2161 type:complete len:767 (-) Transcript_1951:124-2424(-)|eukprot:CAMPEP_0168514264 /NCGR_PEP_ID=MMETSP0405-20121227/3999_1 /TAXON_ID=498012 /ORGANISM="Trichosphaerium sp, Strain Am-I-7 wt" /LENGTH=766 /DNA_ID=CAMNT_0008533343 /DNA_START=736 /DNA_END=3036 /DNA_ORIENTATION=+
MRDTHKLFIVCLFLLTATFTAKAIPIGGLFPHSGGWSIGDRTLPGFELAVRDINADNTILPNHTLEPVANDTECDEGKGLLEFTEFRTRGIQAIVGAGCSVVSTPISSLATYWNIPMVSWGSTSPKLSEKSKHPYFKRVVLPDDQQALAMLDLCKHYGWSRIGILYSQEELHTLIRDKIVEEAPGYSIDVVASESFPGQTGFDVSAAMNRLKNLGIRIIMLICYSSDAVTTFKTAVSLDMASKDYAWIATDASFIRDIWTQSGVTDPDEISLIQRGISGAVGFQPNPTTGPRYPQFETDYLQYTGLSTVETYAAFAYDATWMIARVFHELLEVQGFSYSDSDFGKKVNDLLWNETFSGVTGSIAFDGATGDRSSLPYDLFNYQEGGNYVKVGVWEGTEYVPDPSNAYNWPEGSLTPPSDSPEIKEPELIASVRYTFFALAIIGVLLCIVCGIMTIVYMKHPRIRAASPLFLFVILFGCIMQYISIPINGFKKTEALCSIPFWLVHVGFFLVFGALFIKTYRVWRIFSIRKGKLKKVVITDFELLLPLAAMVSAVIVYLSVYTSIHRRTATRVVDDSDKTIARIKCIHEKDGYLAWEVVLLVVEALWLLFGLILSYQIRKVSILRFNESYYITLSIYNITFLALLLIPIGFVLKTTADVLFVMVSVGVLLATTGVVVLLFWPKFIAILRNKPDTDTTGAASRTLSSIGNNINQTLSAREYNDTPEPQADGESVNISDSSNISEDESIDTEASSIDPMTNTSRGDKNV